MPCARSTARLQGHELARRYGAPAARSTTRPRREHLRATFDVGQLRAARRAAAVRDRAAERARRAPSTLTRLKLYKTGGKAELGELLPMLEDSGLRIVEEVPTRLQRAQGRRAATCTTSACCGPDGSQLDLETLGDAGRRRRRRRVGRPGRERLAQPAGAGRRRCPGARSRSSAPTASTGRCWAAASPSATRTTPSCGTPPGRAADASCSSCGSTPPPSGRRGRRPRRWSAGSSADLDAIASLDEDRILRGVPGHDHGHRAHQCVRAGGDLPYLSFKLRCADVPGIPKPVPQVGDLRLQPGDGGRPPARRQRRPRRHPLERPAGGLPHRDPRA